MKTDDEQEHTFYHAGDDCGQGSPADFHGRRSQIAENKDPIEKNVDADSQNVDNHGQYGFFYTAQGVGEQQGDAGKDIAYAYQLQIVRTQ